MSSVNTGSASGRMRTHRLRLANTRVAHCMVVRERRRLRAGRRTHVVRLLLLLWPASSHGGATHATLASLVGRVVEQSTNVVDEKGVKKLSNSLLVREIQRTVKGYPVCCQY